MCQQLFLLLEPGLQLLLAHVLGMFGDLPEVGRIRRRITDLLRSLTRQTSIGGTVTDRPVPSCSELVPGGRLRSSTASDVL